MFIYVCIYSFCVNYLCLYSGCYKLSKLDDYYYLRLSSSIMSRNVVYNEVDDTKSEHEISTINEVENDNNDEEMFVMFGSMFSSDGIPGNDIKMEKQTSLHDDFSEMWLLLRKSESDVVDVLFYAR